MKPQGLSAIAPDSLPGYGERLALELHPACLPRPNLLDQKRVRYGGDGIDAVRAWLIGNWGISGCRTIESAWL